MRVDDDDGDGVTYATHLCKLKINSLQRCTIFVYVSGFLFGKFYSKMRIDRCSLYIKEVVQTNACINILNNEWIYEMRLPCVFDARWLNGNGTPSPLPQPTAAEATMATTTTTCLVLNILCKTHLTDVVVAFQLTLKMFCALQCVQPSLESIYQCGTYSIFGSCDACVCI